MQITVARVVAFAVTPILTAASAAAVGLLAKYGLSVNPAEVTAFGVAGATAAATACVKFLHDNARFNQAEQKVEHEVKLAAAWAEKVDPGVVAEAQKAAVAEGSTLVQDAVKAIEPTPEQEAAALLQAQGQVAHSEAA